MLDPREFVELPGMYDPFEHPRPTRADLPLSPAIACYGMIGDVCEWTSGDFRSYPIRPQTFPGFRCKTDD